MGMWTLSYKSLISKGLISFGDLAFIKTALYSRKRLTPGQPVKPLIHDESLCIVFITLSSCKDVLLLFCTFLMFTTFTAIVCIWTHCVHLLSVKAVHVILFYMLLSSIFDHVFTRFHRSTPLCRLAPHQISHQIRRLVNKTTSRSAMSVRACGMSM